MTMNATERARRSDSLYYDTQVTNRRALCDMIANLESELAESKAENVTLRELCADMLMCLTWTDEPHGYMEDGCGYCRFKGKTHGACGLKRFRGRSSEMGVELD